jgi:hypothetical protein
MRNAFERWGPVVGNDLRMACGVSTLAYCHEGNVNKIWDNFNNKHMSVAESFINGLGGGDVRPLCITRGGPDISKTPLYDTSFSNRHNDSGNTYLHIMYAAGTETDAPSFSWRPEMVPRKLFRVRLSKSGDLPEFKRGLRTMNLVERLDHALLAGGSATLTRDLASGAMLLKAATRSEPSASATVKPMATLRRDAVNFARNLGWIGDDAGRVEVTKILTASMPVNGTAADIKKGEKGSIVTINRRMPVDGVMLDMLGTGGRVELVLDRDGQVLNANRVWRQTTMIREEVPIKTYERALAEAQRRLHYGAEAYKLANWRFGYKEAGANVEQHELPPIFEFDFVPKDRTRLIDFPPQRIQIDAEAK